jgi:amino acid transporter
MPSSAPGTLHRELSVWEAIGLSLALMAPSMAANINPQATAGTVGRAVPLAFLLATLGVLLIAYTFVRLCQRFHHAGSVYGFVGATLSFVNYADELPYFAQEVLPRLEAKGLRVPTA